MSHIFEGNAGTKFHFNSDLSGQITIQSPEAHDLIPLPEEGINIPASDLYEFFISRIANSEFDAAKLSKIMQDFNLLKIEVHDWNILITRLVG